MIVDLHTHFFRFNADLGPQVRADLTRCGMDAKRWEFTAEDHLKATEAADVAIVFGLRGAATGWNVPNEIVAEHVRRAPRRLLFFASVDPAGPGCMEDLDRCRQELGCRGVKLGPIYQGVHPLDQRYREIYAYCQRHGLPILVHMATTFSSGVPLEYARPALMDQVAVEFPDLKIVLAHLGHPWEAEAIAAIRKQPNLFADVSALYYRPWQFYHAMRLAVEYHAESKLLFGSDYPATTTEESLAGLRNVNAVVGQGGLPGIPQEVVDEIIHRDALRLLEIDDPRGVP